MKVLFCFTALLASAAAFAPQASSPRTTVAVQAERREMFGILAGAAAAALVPAAANAAAGESPRFSVFGVIGDGTSYSEGAAYGSDQSSPLYSPYSVYDNQGDNSAYKPGGKEEIDRKVAILVETKNRLTKLDRYIQRKEWYNVKDELTRYMYETRGAVRGLSETPAQKKAATAFFRAMEDTYTAATLRKQEVCASSAAASIVTLEAFVKTL
eukprot:CAMPEP_0197824972 /NCGR_PEP_ID=MMETSP1437-20131217/2138_1 /TAXON_ID=49252 ORGANISM="Eucampia antarctica, Strain CCMP1452" /NCGR_SAMPLE_ID=MMETSP1437 /ASSEMBLY_ACC=CAM_ASM_001096 /LENGTH=211 /DNA_ID=CAMNT_0043424797 /DNA_START=50 /DNA_END=685 /DNA_ORIENTATION=-